MKKEHNFDFIVIGGSYAGLAAAMALGRSVRHVLVIDAGTPCNRQTPQSHNFITNDGRPPGEIGRFAREQVSAYETVRFFDGLATGIRRINPGFEVEVQSGEIYSARKLVIATGIRDILPPIPGIGECWGISVLHCPYCHGYEVRQQQTGILANGDEAFDLATLISNWTNHLTIFTNGPALFSEAQNTTLRKHGIPIIEAPIESIEHKNGYIDHILLMEGTRQPLKALYAKLPFEQQSILQSLGFEITADGYIKVDSSQRTSVPGIYACGDNAAKMRTVANAVGMGTTAGMMANKEMTEEEFLAK